MRRSFLRLGVAISLLGAVLACGPVTSTITMNSAEVALETARLEEAEQYATYEFVSAAEYYDKALEEWGYSDWQKAEEYAQRALEFAQAALARARATERIPTSPANFEDDDY